MVLRYDKCTKTYLQVVNTKAHMILKHHKLDKFKF